jgi:hypothetical protein
MDESKVKLGYLVSQGFIHGQGKNDNHIWEVTWIEYGYNIFLNYYLENA